MGMLLDILGGVGDVLDTPGRFTRTALAGRNPFATVFDPSKGVSGRDLLQQYGMVGENRDGLDGGDIGGFLAEMALDPTNLIGGGLLAKVMGKASKARLANKGIEAANALSLKQRLQGFMPEEVAKLTKIVDETGQPKRMFHGTAHVYDKPDPSKWHPDALYGPGHYTTDSTEVASSYTKKEATGRYPTMDEIRDHFKPGSIVPSYGGGRDKVIELIEGGPAGWSVKVQAVDGSGNPLRERPRIHSTAPKVVDPEHVRMAFIDARNPLNIDEPVTTITAPLEKQLIQRNRDDIRAAIADAKQSRNKVQWLKNAPDEDVGYSSFGQSIRDPESVKRIRETLTQLATANKENAVNRLRNQLPFRHKATLSPRMTGEDVYNLIGNDGVREAGYDAINYIGGRNTGGAAHNVTIALDPSQVYLPYIAKEIEKLMQVPNAKPLVSALLGQNTMARFGRTGQPHN